ncbi:hypothetical protein L3X38_021331 [Prunus dulcis]|uniref:Uncharacterized protein n=1 Tax=Prunus dulcis TaxID=3755 RepID=A0AAD4VTU6_PRUDU|nr:hypothetical protein L3X38_021331 [Prunus dulcis]
MEPIEIALEGREENSCFYWGDGFSQSVRQNANRDRGIFFPISVTTATTEVNLGTAIFSYQLLNLNRIDF